jgi:hypothetical protein
LDLSFVEIARQGRQLAWTADGNNLVDWNKFLSDNKLRSQRIYLRLQGRSRFYRVEPVGVVRAGRMGDAEQDR